MFKKIVLFASILFLIGCENQLTNPEDFDSMEVNKDLNNESLLLLDGKDAQKTYKTVPMLSEYNFNSEAKNHKCGGFLNKCYLEYDYENERERFVRNVKFYSPSKLVIDNKSYKTFSIYTINKRELLSNKGAVTGGSTWGSFTVYKCVESPIIYDEYGTINSDIIAEHPLKHCGPKLLEGKFTGEINGNVIIMELVGTGADELKGGQLTAIEEMKCGSRYCWRSKISGKFKRVDYIDE